MSYTKATLSDIEMAGRAAQDTASAAVASGDRAAGVSRQMEQGVGQLADTLMRHFQDVAARMREEAGAVMRRLGATDWEGRSREMAVAAQASLHGRLDATLASAESGTSSFRTQLEAQAQDFVAGVNGQFASVLSSIDAAYQDLARAEETFAANLVQADQTIQTEG